ncbi:fungal-specific transcription factor domain-containing protein [Xylariaceae sp. FL0594]|nr:fungal-specific transcription factor domain-containing protein [Xylariaceae sp. FL0594]
MESMDTYPPHPPSIVNNVSPPIPRKPVNSAAAGSPFIFNTPAPTDHQRLPVRGRRMNAAGPSSEITPIACARCRNRKIRCERRRPCAPCQRADAECRRVGTGEKQRPTPKSYVQGLEAQVASLEMFIQTLAASDDKERQQMLDEFSRVIATTAASEDLAAGLGASPSSSAKPSGSGDHVDAEEEGRLSPARAGQLRKTRSGSSAHFYGGTSLYHIRLSEAGSAGSPSSSLPVVVDSAHEDDIHETTSSMEMVFGQTLWNKYPVSFAAHDDTSQRLMAAFFKHQYQYSMCIYREFFLRDYDTGGGRHYSDLLLFAICATGALAGGEGLLSHVFANQAQALLYPSLNHPDLTVLQALILLGQLEIGRGRASKGWLFCGMAFRLAHEMGLHLDPTNWQDTEDPDVEREILRRVYWAAFVVDKQLSLYFGRPPALYPQVSDVRTTERIPYPPDWQSLLDIYIAPDTSVTAFEDGICLVNCLKYRIELYRIVHSMITEVFENRRTNAGRAVVAATISRIHVSLTKWLAGLPSNLHWNQWTIGQLPQWVYHLHLLFHTVMTILHRPPSHLLQNAGSSFDRDDIEICYESLNAMLRLIKAYSRFYKFKHLPLDFVQTLSTIAGTILLRRHLDNLPWDDAETSKSLDLVISTMEDIKDTWPCVREILNSVLDARRAETEGAMPLVDLDHAVMELDFLNAAPPPSADAAGFGYGYEAADNSPPIYWPPNFGNVLAGSMLPNWSQYGFPVAGVDFSGIEGMMHDHTQVEQHQQQQQHMPSASPPQSFGQ